MPINQHKLVCNLSSDWPLLRRVFLRAVQFVSIAIDQVVHYVFRTDNPFNIIEVSPFEPTSNREAAFNFPAFADMAIQVSINLFRMQIEAAS